jgi:RNA polymerase sigma factor (sigma-70 family)
MEQQFETLQTYINLAKKTISKFSPSFYSGLRNELLSNEDAIADIAQAIMTADWKWDKDRTGHEGKSKTKYSYRNQCAIWAIQTYITNKYKKKNMSLSLDSSYDNSEEVSSFAASIPDKEEYDPAIIAEQNEEENNLQSMIKNILESDILSDKQRDQIYSYYFDNKTLLQIGKEYGVTREAIRQNIQKGLSKIRAYA